jgi:two-component system response regulator
MDEKRILLAEDDPAHVLVFSQAVARSGLPCHLDVVHDGVETIEFLFALGEHADRQAEAMPDLILLDLTMPRMNGLQVLQVLRRVRDDNLRLPPVVVLTAADEEESVAEAYRYGAQSYICKPVEIGQFIEAVQETLSYWLGRNQPAPPVRRQHFQHHLPHPV